MNDLEQFLSNEPAIDQKIAQLPILQLPVRVPLSMILGALHRLAHGLLTTNVQPEIDKAMALGARLSHLVPFLASCPSEPSGTNAREVLETYHRADPDLKQSHFLFSYAHFADLMPEVHRGYFSVTRSGGQRFSLRHASTEIAQAEAEDILLSELALGFRDRAHSLSHEFFFVSPPLRNMSPRLRDCVAFSAWSCRLLCVTLTVCLGLYMRIRFPARVTPSSLSEAVFVPVIELMFRLCLAMRTLLWARLEAVMGAIEARDHPMASLPEPLGIPDAHEQVVA